MACAIESGGLWKIDITDGSYVKLNDGWAEKKVSWWRLGVFAVRPIHSTWLWIFSATNSYTCTQLWCFPDGSLNRFVLE